MDSKDKIEILSLFLFLRIICSLALYSLGTCLFRNSASESPVLQHAFSATSKHQGLEEG
jgi:hypothetical protein